MGEKLTKSLEKYLIAIDTLLETHETIIVKDVAKFLGYGGATASDAIKKLKEKGYVNYEPYGSITLTELGEKTVIIKKYRHNTITKFLNKVLDIELKKDFPKKQFYICQAKASLQYRSKNPFMMKLLIWIKKIIK